MLLQTISQVSKSLSVSTRALRYYDQLGLVPSTSRDDYAYRVYDEAAVRRLRHVVVLRKLRIPLKDIVEVLGSQDATTALALFEAKVRGLSDEIAALSTVRSILEEFVVGLRERHGVPASLDWLDDAALLSMVGPLAMAKANLKEANTMEDLNRADERLAKLTDVRIVYLPPATVASIHRIGGSPELDTGDELQAFTKDKQLAELKPDFRHYGFNHPNGERPDGTDHGYERWVTIPADMEVEEPFVKKQFPGGMYAAHMIPMGSFEEWHWLCDWAKGHPQYEPAWGDSECMDGLLEEHLNYINLYTLSREESDKRMQLDLLIPIRER